MSMTKSRRSVYNKSWYKRECFLYNKNTNYCRGQSSKLQREFPYYCRVLFGIFLSSQFL